MVAFNGGTQGGRPLVKVYAYSYDTNVAIYTEATLDADGSLIFEVPQLTADSSVTALNLAIPSTDVTLERLGSRHGDGGSAQGREGQLRPGQVLDRKLGVEHQLHPRHP